MNKINIWLIFGGISGFLAMGLSAIGSHYISQLLTDYSATYDIAVRNQLFHSLGLLLIGILYETRNNRYVLISGICFLLGIILFSGSLYVYIFTTERVFTFLTPFGGVLLILGWISIAISGFKHNNQHSSLIK